MTASVLPLIDAKGAVNEENALQVQDRVLLLGSEASRQKTVPSAQTACLGLKDCTAFGLKLRTSNFNRNPSLYD